MSTQRALGSEPPRFTGFRTVAHGWLVVLVASTLLGAGQLHAAPEPVAPADELAGQLHAGGRVTYTLPLPGDHYVDLVVRAPGLRLRTVLRDPDDAQLVARSPVQSPGGTATLTAITTSAGRYRVEIAAEPEPGTGADHDGIVPVPASVAVSVSIERLRPASPADRLDVVAEGHYLGAYEAGRERSEAGRRQAVEDYRQALALFQRSGSASGEAKTRHALATVLARLGDTDGARQELESAIPRWQAAGLVAEEIDSRTTLGLMHKRLGRPDDALTQYRMAMPIAEGAEDGKRLARLWHNQGAALKDLDRLTEAAHAYEHALALRITASDTRGEASTRSNLGTLYERMGDYRRAAEQLDQALRLLEAAGSRRLEAPLNNLGTVYNSLGQPARARLYFERALALAAAREDQPAEARTLNNIGWSLLHEGENDQAIATFHRALRLLEAHGDQEGQAATLTNLARTHAVSGDPRTARTLLERALQLRRQLDDRLGEAATLSNLAEALRASDDPDGAWAAAERARLLAHQADDPRTLAWALFVLARLAQDQGRLELAHRRMAAAVDLIESLRSRSGGADWRTSFVASKHAYYEALIDIEMARFEAEPSSDWHARAFATSERARARALVDTLMAASVEEPAQADHALLDRERQISQRINALAHARQAAADPPPPATDTALAEALAEQQLVRARLTGDAPNHLSRTRSAILDAEAVQAQLDEETIFLELALGETRSAIWLIDRQQVMAARLPSRTVIEAASRTLWDLLTARSDAPAGEHLEARRARIAAADRAAHDASVALGKMLFGPLATQLHGRRLIIATDGILAYLPIAALPHPASGRALIDDFEIVSVPSATALTAIRRETQRRQTTPPSPDDAKRISVAIMANPVFGTEPAKSSSREAHRAPLRGGTDMPLVALPWTADEARAIATLAGDEARLITGADASRERVMGGGLANARIVHLATHGILDSEHPELSALVLSTVDAEGNAVDGFLRLHDIYGLELDADLVVLSACQTALGTSVRGEGLIGLARGFMHAGAARVLASLWQVRDDATAELMGALYRRLLAGEPASQALRHAQLALRERHAAPYFWAGFVLQGDWR